MYLIKFINFFDWNNVPWESRLALRLFGIKNRDSYLKWLFKAQEKYPLGKELKDLTLAERVVLNLPVLALALMVIGSLLCFNYSALWRFLDSIFWYTKRQVLANVATPPGPMPENPNLDEKGSPKHAFDANLGQSVMSVVWV
jgi:hypothetical protein